MSLDNSLSDTLAGVLEQDSIELRDLFACAGQYSFSFLFILVGLFVMIPLPPGGGILPGLLVFFWGLQRALGLEAPWLPNWLLNRRIDQKTAALLLTKALPVMRKLELRLAQEGPLVPTELEMRLGSFLAGAMGLFIVLPTPFLNRFPALGAILIGLSQINRNRRFLLLSILYSIVTSVFMTMFLVTSGAFLWKEIDERI